MDCAEGLDWKLHSLPQCGSCLRPVQIGTDDTLQAPSIIAANAGELANFAFELFKQHRFQKLLREHLAIAGCPEVVGQDWLDLVD